MSGIIKPNSPRSSDVRDRLFALAVAAPDTIVKTVLFDNATKFASAGSPSKGRILGECDLPPADLPALIGITPGASSFVRASTGTRIMQRVYTFEMLFYQLCDGSAAEQIAALEALWDHVDELPDYYASVYRLKLNDSGLRGVESVEQMTDVGTEITMRGWDKFTYSGMAYTLPINTSR